MDLADLPDSRERTGASVLWLSCEGQMDVLEKFSDSSYLSAILDRQGLLVAAPIDLRKKMAESFSPQLLQGLWLKLKRKNPKIVVVRIFASSSTPVGVLCLKLSLLVPKVTSWFLTLAVFSASLTLLVYLE